MATKDKTKNSKNNKLQHDALFKRIMESEIAAKEFIDEYLPAEVKDMINLDSVKVEKESYVEPNLTKRLSDIIYSVDVKGKQDEKAFIYILAEHQSTIDQLMAFRLWRYTLLLAERHIKDKAKLPLIFPIVVYAGKSKYTAARNLWDLFKYPKLAKKLLTEDYKLIDLQAKSDDEITRKKHIALFEYVLKHIHTRDMLKLWADLFRLLPAAVELDQEHGYFYIRNFVWYTDTKLPEAKRDDLSNLIIEHLSKNEGENIMKSFAETYMEKGIEKGREEAITKTAIKMLEQKADIEFVAKVTGLSHDQLLKLKNQI